jgi:sugar fermentation stimulation protein A
MTDNFLKKTIVGARKGIFIKRYKRFLVDFKFEDEVITGYCPNPGKMADILIEGMEIMVRPQEGGKYAWRWFAIKIDGIWIGVDTHMPNELAAIILKKEYPQLNLRAEVKFGRSRFDFADENNIFEIKNVHWKLDGAANFPDCPTKRGAKHLLDLSGLTKYERTLIYIIQREDVNGCYTAEFIDPDYAAAMQRFQRSGGKIRAFAIKIQENNFVFYKEVDYLGIKVSYFTSDKS